MANLLLFLELRRSLLAVGDLSGQCYVERSMILTQYLHCQWQAPVIGLRLRNCQASLSVTDPLQK